MILLTALLIRVNVFAWQIWEYKQIEPYMQLFICAPKIQKQIHLNVMLPCHPCLASLAMLLNLVIPCCRIEVALDVLGSTRIRVLAVSKPLNVGHYVYCNPF